jgi:hypothetical protein
MPLPRATLIAFLVSGFIIACGRDVPAARHDSASAPASETKDSSTPPTSTRTWPDDAGPALLIQGETSAEAIVVLPGERDSSTALRTIDKPYQEVALLASNGARGAGQLGSPTASSDQECRIRTVQRSQGNGGWAVGFVSKLVTPLPLDSIESSSSRDSAALTTEAARLASSVTALTSPSFEGLRFSVHEVRRFRIPGGGDALVAHVIRRVNQEANPQEEQTLLIAERDSGVTSGPYKLIYADREHGAEDSVIAPEVLAAVVIGGRITLIVARDSEDGVAYELLERDANQHWRVRWSSAPVRCG